MPARLISHYRLIRRLGAGGMGEVYLAQDTQLERPIALKVMSAELARDPNQRKRFRAEAKAASGLSHPHICTIYDVGETKDGRPFLAMEYVEGQTLHEILQVRRLAPREIVKLGIEVAEALNSAHEQGLVHRDIKPANLMLNRRAEVKIMDFGLAKRFTPAQLSGTLTSVAHTRTGMLIGTPQYMSPEQALGHPLDPRTDIFSLGTVLYEVVAGQRPFLGQTIGESINNIVNQTPAPLGLEDPLFSPALDHIIFKCLEKDPDKRYTSAFQLAADLRKLLEPEQASAAAAPERTATPIGATPGQRPATALWKLAAREDASRKAALHWIFGVAGVVALAVAVWMLLDKGKPKSPAAGTNAGATTLGNSVAVLPFMNLSGDKTNEYLSGISGEIIDHLSKLRGLKVPVSSACFAFKDKQTNVREIGRSLQVSTVLKGSFCQNGDQVRILAQLVKAADASTIWSHTYDRKLGDVPELGVAVARDVAEALVPAEARQLSLKVCTTNTEAYNFYMTGRELWEHRTKKDFVKAIECFTNAIAKDPSFAQAHAALADCYFLCWEGLPREKAFARMREEASRALELDPTLGEPHAVLACVKAYFEWDWPGAEQEFRRATELNPNYATAHLWFARTLRVLRRSDEALAEIEYAHERDPLSPAISGYRGALLAESGRADEAIKLLREQNQHQPSVLLRSALASAYSAKGMWSEAIAELETLPMEDANWGMVRAALGFAHARAGNVYEAQRILGQILELDRQGGATHGGIEAAVVQHALGDDEFAIDNLELVFAENPTGLQDLNCDWCWDDLRSHPRVQAMLRKMNLVK